MARRRAVWARMIGGLVKGSRRGQSDASASELVVGESPGVLGGLSAGTEDEGGAGDIGRSQDICGMGFFEVLE
jgi:hypothetical protein